ncbi:plasmid partitioning protein RepB C-terminal domain-containing protein [Niveispirillum sp.]|uniref:plasmid partitioning protein RepB C-terminal domain-containing protein n=1 Tax=Niveispirillum sp. TaxID=1917217 RepID=UPI001B71817E|nr:plasmid partitioning protein RepB C-terminal domain-containing protein [Niveispirillum sp.]MBP7339343.1 ParB N-terminal domain-containing protein [Niveispirillum sp.]
MSASRRQRMEMIPIGDIHILNPRARNKRQHREIVDSIDNVGLKRPITVRLKPGSNPARYELVCGEGRLEALRMLGEAMIPAIVIEAPETECLVMSLVENIARRQHRPIDLMQEIGSLHKRGYSDVEIGKKIGVTASWANMVVKLFERGEERLIAAVESGLIPIALAVDIARADSSEVQNVLMDAYAAGKIKGKKLAAIRRMLDQRMKRSKEMPDSGLGRKNGSRRLTAADLMRVYQREAERQRLLVKKSDYAQAKLLFIVEALKDLRGDEAFTTLLRAEGLSTMPRALATRISGEATR